jgi:hypothetical protein
VKSWVSISGTTINCAGGATPWDSWITCEETVVGTRLAKGLRRPTAGASMCPPRPTARSSPSRLLTWPVQPRGARGRPSIRDLRD